MGLFQHRPEEPTEWAGLPSEPWEPRSPSEVLAPPLATPPLLDDGIQSVVIALPAAGDDTDGVTSDSVGDPE